jgi:hypothetical protein
VTGRLSRRGLLLATAGGLTAAAVQARPVLGASDDELAFANFGVSAELLLEDFYARVLEARVFTGPRAKEMRRGRSAAAQHATALRDLLVGAGQTAPASEDFAFEWPRGTFTGAASAMATGRVVLRALLASYQTAVASVADPSYRVLYASLAASAGQQLGALSALSGRAGAEPFPVAVDLEAASAALERYLG